MVVVARYSGKEARLYCRADAAFAMPEMYEFLEAEGIKYTIRSPANRIGSLDATSRQEECVQATRKKSN